jgi:hypothetical protein
MQLALPATIDAFRAAQEADKACIVLARHYGFDRYDSHSTGVRGSALRLHYDTKVNADRLLTVCFERDRLVDQGAAYVETQL